MGAFLFSLLSPQLATAGPMSLAEFGQAALRCGPSVSPATLASIARTESMFEPFSINDNTTGRSTAPPTETIAVKLAKDLLALGHSIDLGIMQINSGNFARVGLTPETAFDPCRSIGVAASILAENYAGGETHDAQQASLRVALSKYNTGNARRGFDNGYVRKVELAARQVVPALDVGDDAPPAAAPVVAAGPNTPPAWDVWAAYDYATSNNSASQSIGPQNLELGAAVLTSADHRPSAPATNPDLVLEK